MNYFKRLITKIYTTRELGLAYAERVNDMGSFKGGTLKVFVKRNFQGFHIQKNPHRFKNRDNQ